MANAQRSHGIAHGKCSPQAPIENPNGVPSFSPGLPRPALRDGATLGNIPQDPAADREAARQREFELRPINYSSFPNQVNSTVSHRKSGSRKVMQAKKSNARCHFTSPKPIPEAWIFSDAWKLAPCRVEAKRRRVQPPLNFLLPIYLYLPLITPIYRFWPPPCVFLLLEGTYPKSATHKVKQALP
jgi:hypothetical protein